MSGSAPPPAGKTDRPSQRPGGAASLLGTTIGGRYRIDSILGEGGMGTVYAAEHTLMRKRVALKVLHPHMSAVPDVVARFEREALAAGHIDHPNIAAATDFGQLADGSFFLVLELVVGENLHDLIAKGPLPAARVVHIGTQIADALGRAHSLGVVHRDLKPENVMLITRGADADFVKVLDFGIAKVPVLDPGAPPSLAEPSPLSGPTKALTMAGMIYGTPAYMSPEQALGQPVDGRADLYAVGVLLFEMLTGRRPFEHENMASLLGLQVAAPIPSMAERAPDAAVPPALEAVVRRLLAKDPADRFATAGELEAALREAGGVILPGDGAPPPGSVHVSVDASVADTGAMQGVPPGSSPTAGLPRGRKLGVVAAVAVAGLGLLWALSGSQPSPSASTVAVVASSPASAGAAVAPPPADTSPAPAPTALDAAPDDPLLAVLVSADAALARGDAATAIGAIAPVLAANAKRADVHRILERAYAMKQDRAAALREANAWLGLDRAASADLGLQRDIGAIATNPSSSEAAISILASQMGAPGVDILYDLGFASTQDPTVASRAQGALSRPDVRAHAGPAAAVLLDLRAAKTCPARRALLPRVQTDGDRRALAILQPWTNRRTPETGCMRGDRDLPAAIAAVRGRTGML